jgi:hypothetical protein
VPVVDDATGQGYVRQAHTLGKKVRKQRPVRLYAISIFGYIRITEIPNYASFPDGRLWATVVCYKELLADAIERLLVDLRKLNSVGVFQAFKSST